ncbi:MAG TPA: ABC transporter permease [Gaiellaceae bacterium]|nr:ABC transporter permease [Gaiellaceae bacterium]
MIDVAPSGDGRITTLVRETMKIPAFARRDLIVAWSYRFAFFSDAFGLVLQAFLFYFVGLLVDERRLPEYGGAPVTYMEFVAIGIALAAFVSVGLGRIATALRREQMMGTLESMLLTPTSPATIQLGSVVYDLVYVPIRTAIFLVVIAVGFDLDFNTNGLLPALLVILAFVPFVWGLGLVSAAGTLTFRGGATGVNFGVTVLTLASGAFFPLELLPGWLTAIAEVNPMAIAIDGMRQPLLGVVSWSETARAVGVLAPLSLVSVAVGALAFRLALQRERRRGTLGLY